MPRRFEDKNPPLPSNYKPSDDSQEATLLSPKKSVFQLTLSDWGVAAVIAGLESLLEHDLTLEQGQRVAISAMVGSMRKELGSKNGL